MKKARDAAEGVKAKGLQGIWVRKRVAWWLGSRGWEAKLN